MANDMPVRSVVGGPWFRVPTFVGSLRVSDPVQAQAWIDVLLSWHNGLDVTTYALRKSTKWSLDRVKTFLLKVGFWAVENGAAITEKVKEKLDPLQYLRPTYDRPTADLSGIGSTATKEAIPTYDRPITDLRPTISCARDPFLKSRSETEIRDRENNTLVLDTPTAPEAGPLPVVQKQENVSVEVSKHPSLEQQSQPAQGKPVQLPQAKEEATKPAQVNLFADIDPQPHEQPQQKPPPTPPKRRAPPPAPAEAKAQDASQDSHPSDSATEPHATTALTPVEVVYAAYRKHHPTYPAAPSAGSRKQIQAGLKEASATDLSLLIEWAHTSQDQEAIWLQGKAKKSERSYLGLENLMVGSKVQARVEAAHLWQKRGKQGGNNKAQQIGQWGDVRPDYSKVHSDPKGLLTGPVPWERDHAAVN